VRWRTVATLAASTLGAPGVIKAQDSVRAGWRGESFVGSTRFALDASYQRLATGVPLITASQGSVVFAPIVSQHWQLGVAPSWQFEKQQSNSYYVGTAGLLANYLLGAGEVSRPYVGLFFSETGRTHSKSFHAWGGQAGWLHFLSPAIALRAELIWRRNPAMTRGDAIVTLNPYLFGRANERFTTPSLGVIDVAVLADMEVTPERIGFLNSTIAPFLTRWLQIGGSEDLAFFFSQNEGAHELEFFGRGYLPLRTRVMPFAELFTHSSFITGEPALRAHGERAGLRTYLAPGVALDLGFEWRDYSVEHLGTSTFRQPEERLLHVGVMTQVRAARAR
jgi:hypothetical protein